MHMARKYAGCAVAVGLTLGAVANNCWVSNGTSNNCCASRVKLCGEWSCSEYSSAGPFTVRKIRHANLAEPGLNNLVNTNVGSCTFALMTCGQSVGECIAAGTSPITYCDNTDPAGEGCVGDGQT